MCGHMQRGGLYVGRWQGREARPGQQPFPVGSCSECIPARGMVLLMHDALSSACIIDSIPRWDSSNPFTCHMCGLVHVQVESLVGRASITSAALADQHTLFLDGQGSLWSCGENKEGQCGLGTPLEVIAQQHHKALYDSIGSMNRQANGDREAQKRSLRKYLRTLMAHSSPTHQQMGSSSSAGAGLAAASASYWQAHNPSPGWVGAPATNETARMALGTGGFDMEAHFLATGLQAGHQHTPMRIGRDQHPLSTVHLSSRSYHLREIAYAGLEKERVVHMAASRHFSVAVSDKGEVWTFGADYHGSLGSNSSWSTSAQKVAGPLAQVIADHGGAVRVAAAASFCLALTAAGKVVVWGKVPVLEGPSKEVLHTPDGLSVVLGNSVCMGEIPGLPPIKHIAAGQQHALMSDGECVWMIGRGMTVDGNLGECAPWDKPLEVLRLPDQGVEKVACGAHASAAVCGDGRLWLWGRLLDSRLAHSLVKQELDHQQHSELVLATAQWDWAGYGADTPSPVAGISGVQDIALGGWHAMVLMS